MINSECSKCKTPITENSNFCPNCGKKIEEESISSIANNSIKNGINKKSRKPLYATLFIK